MKKLLILLFLLPMIALQAQKTAKTRTPAPKATATAAAANDKVTLVCKIWGVPANTDSVNLYEMLGLANRVVARAGRRMPDSAFVFRIPMSDPRFYGVGLGDNAMAKVVLGQEKEVTLWANCNFMEKGRTVNSPANKALENVQRQIADFQSESEVLRTKYYNSDGNLGAAARTPVEESIKQLAKSKSRYLDSLKTANPMLWRMASLYITPEYLAEKSAATTEVDFYTKNYFRNADFNSTGFDNIPDVFNSFEKYVTYLAQIAASSEKVKQAIDLQLSQIPAKSKAYRMALGGAISGLKTTNGQLCTAYTSDYLNLYRNNSLGEVARLEYDIKKAGTFMPGFEAPDLIGMTPDSSNYSLKQLRGKIVMVDFWASWCGPCRRENPNVVENYKKYKDKGFDVLGVSLDRDISAWRKAIQQDGLPWHHISDLKGWQSEHAALYSVTSIPQTLLIDREGKIIVRNLRGEQLGEKLKEIFGE